MGAVLIIGVARWQLPAVAHAAFPEVASDRGARRRCASARTRRTGSGCTDDRIRRGRSRTASTTPWYRATRSGSAPDDSGTKVAARSSLDIAAGATEQVTLRLTAASESGAARGMGDDFAEVLDARRSECAAFYAGLTWPERGRCVGDAPGTRRDAVDQAVLLLRPQPVARRQHGVTSRSARSRPWCSAAHGTLMARNAGVEGRDSFVRRRGDGASSGCRRLRCSSRHTSMTSPVSTKKTP